MSIFRKVNISILLLVIITGCNQTTIDSKHLAITSTSTFVEPPYMECDPLQIDKSIYPIPINSPIILTNGLILEEYSSEYIADCGWPHPGDSGCMYVIDRVHNKNIHLNNRLQVLLTPIDNNSELVLVIREGRIVFETNAYNFVYSGLLSAWSYGEHWIIEILSRYPPEIGIINKDRSDLYIKQDLLVNYIDIIQGGKSLKDSNGYDQVFSFQILNNKPFYFYKKGGVYGINYDGTEANLEYTSISLPRLHPGLESFIFHFKNMVLFHAIKDDESIEVVIGPFN